MRAQKIEPRRFRLVVAQRGFTSRDLARALRTRGVAVSAGTVARFGHEPPSTLPSYARELAALLKTKVGYLTGEHGQFMAKRFRDLYTARGYTLAQLAEHLAEWNVNVSPQYLQQLAVGRNTNPRQEIVDTLAWCLHTSPNYLMGICDIRDTTTTSSAGIPSPGRVQIAARGGLAGLPPDLRRILTVIAQHEAQAAAHENDS